MGQTNPTDRNYRVWGGMYDLFNAGLFGNRLPGSLITFQRKRGAYGFYAWSLFKGQLDHPRVDEIALNPRAFAHRSARDVLATLVHEMAHQHQWHFGKPGRGNYHNKEWARLMIDIGLVPSDTGEPGGKATGRRVHHLVREGGPFDLVCTHLLNSGFTIPYIEERPEQQNEFTRRGEELRAQKAASKSRYTCPDCFPTKHVWGKRALSIVCGECGAPFEPDDQKDRPDIEMSKPPATSAVAGSSGAERPWPIGHTAKRRKALEDEMDEHNGKPKRRLLIGARAIALEMYGDAAFARRVFHLADKCSKFPVFKHGSQWAAWDTDIHDYLCPKRRRGDDDDDNEGN